MDYITRRTIRHGVIVVVCVGLLALLGWAVWKDSQYQAQLMADCLSAHKQWVVVESHHVHTLQKIGNTYYPQNYVSETYGCVE